MDEAFALQVTQNARGPVVRLAGELDLDAAPAFEASMRTVCGELVTIDFSEVTFMDSTALGVLVAAHNRAALDGGEILLHGVQPNQMRIFEITGLTDRFKFDP